MSSRELNYNYHEFGWQDNFDPEVLQLVEIAKEAAGKAYAPYSGFSVGAAVKLENGETLSASNQENAAYPSGLCAERTVLFFANSNYPDVPIVKMVLVAFDKGELTTSPVYPCGACRQVMMETQDRFKKKIEVWMAGRDKIHMVNSIDPLLPLKFTF